MPGSLPDFVIIGAQKAATTSLYFYLQAHPEIAMSPVKELHFFCEELNWSRGLDWYRGHFRHPDRVQGEASPGYASIPEFPGVPARMAAILPEAKLIYVVREPVERMVSHYAHRWADNREDRPLAEAFTPIAADNRYICRSLYARQLEAFLEVYPRARILILSHDDFRHRRGEVIAETYRFLEVDAGFRPPGLAQEANRTYRKRRKTPLGLALAQGPAGRGVAALPWHLRSKAEYALFYPFSRPVRRPELPEVLAAELRAFLAPDIARLRALSGLPLAEWRV